MCISLLFPSDYFYPSKIDATYEREHLVASESGLFDVFLFPYDQFIEKGNTKLFPGDDSIPFYSAQNFIYRGWMLKPDQYNSLYSSLEKKHIRLINTPEEYELCHFFPKVYPYVKDDTPRILWFPKDTLINYNTVLSTFNQFIIKDAVKSVKGSDFPTSFKSSELTPETLHEYVSKFIQLRGTLYDGGIVFKEYVPLKVYGSTTNEYRAFYLKGHVLSVSKNSEQGLDTPFVPKYLIDKYRHLNSSYYTIDFAELSNGEWVIIEAGDGQVSGLSPSQLVFKYYEEMNIIYKDWLDSYANKRLGLSGTECRFLQRYFPDFNLDNMRTNNELLATLHDLSMEHIDSNSKIDYLGVQLEIIIDSIACND